MSFNPFERKYERAAEWQREQRAARDANSNKGMDDVELSDLMEKHDTFAMIVAALITILPVALVVLAALAAAGYFFIIR